MLMHELRMGREGAAASVGPVPGFAVQPNNMWTQSPNIESYTEMGIWIIKVINLQV
jgi:hypothetical protein